MFSEIVYRSIHICTYSCVYVYIYILCTYVYIYIYVYMYVICCPNICVMSLYDQFVLYVYVCSLYVIYVYA